jgi:murein DD-endopeptidase MepM/ murein hydrolase activator NlpD
VKRLLATALVALATAGGAAADTFTVVPSTSVPVPSASAPDISAPAGSTLSLLPADQPNDAGATAFPLQLSLPPVQPVSLGLLDLQSIWQGAGEAYGIPWQVLGAINKVESNFGRNMGPSSAGAVGWMQFMPDTWARWGMDADGDGVADPWTPTDAIYSAARYLAAAGGREDIARGVFAYNHADWYVNEVLSLAQTYAGGVTDTQGVEDLQQRLAVAEQAVAAASQALVDARAPIEELQREEQATLLEGQEGTLLSDQLIAQKELSDVQGRLLEAQALVDQRQTELETAQAELEAARSGSQGAAFAPGTGSLLGAPEYQGGYVFPVGGGPGLVFVGPNHHDYPAADIAAPQGSPVYALADGYVASAWSSPQGNCGIGFTLQTLDGLTWTYCHLAYLEPTVTLGVQLPAGTPVGLVGETGHAEGPHLHLQLQPASAYPQDETWFAAFAGTAFSWKTDSQSNPAPAPVFAVLGAPETAPVLGVPETPSAEVVYFSA